jgi:hypothetical protein
MEFKVGDKVVLANIPPWVPKLPLETRLVFSRIHGKSCSIAAIDENGLLVLDTDGLQYNIRVEAEFVAPSMGQA